MITFKKSKLIRNISVSIMKYEWKRNLILIFAVLETVYITVYCRKLVCTRFPFSALRDLVLPMFA